MTRSWKDTMTSAPRSATTAARRHVHLPTPGALPAGRVPRDRAARANQVPAFWGGVGRRAANGARRLLGATLVLTRAVGHPERPARPVLMSGAARFRPDPCPAALERPGDAAGRAVAERYRPWRPRCTTASGSARRSTVGRARPTPRAGCGAGPPRCRRTGTDRRPSSVPSTSGRAGDGPPSDARHRRGIRTPRGKRCCADRAHPPPGR